MIEIFAILKKEIESDFKEVDLDWKAPIFCGTVRTLMKKSSLSKAEKKVLNEHLDRYDKACQKDFKLRFPRLFDKLSSYADKRGKDWMLDFADNAELLIRTDAYSVQNDFGPKAFNVYIHLSEDKQLDFVRSLNSISLANLPLKEIERRKAKYIDSYFNNLFRKSKAIK